jgi:NhaP-type Na+/H+ or K+/H+ antiporter
MNKHIVVSFLIGILIGSGIGYICFWLINREGRSKSLYDVKVGIFYYVWYDPNLSVSWRISKNC